MKRIFILFSALVLGFSASAQMNQHSNYIGLNVGGGLNTMTFDPVDGDWNLKLGFLGELKYAHFFGEHFGLGFGVQYNHSRAGATFNGDHVVSHRLVHPEDGLEYDHHTSYKDWKETQTLHTLSVPIQLYWRSMMGERWAFILGLGASLDFNMGGSYSAKDGEYRTFGWFPSTHVYYGRTEDNLHGFGKSPDSGWEGDVEVAKFGVSAILDLGFNYALSNKWGLYFGIYGGYGFTNLKDEDLQKASENTPLADVVLDNAGVEPIAIKGYNGVINSNQIDALHLLNAGVKVGINFGWSCDHNAKKESTAPVIVPVEEPVDAAASEEERCDARRKNDTDMAMAMQSIDADLAEAEKVANENGDVKAKAAIAKAKKEAAEAKEAHKNGHYCKAYDTFKNAYGSIAATYAATAKACANAKAGNKVAAQAADDAQLYATASRNDGLDAAIAASRNAKINEEIACQPEKKKSAHEDIAYSERLSREAMAMGTIAQSQEAQDLARKAAELGKAGNFAESFATSAESFAKSADAFAAKCNKPEAKKLAKEANAAAAAAREAAKQGDIETAYTKAVEARDIANRIPTICAKAEPMKQAEVQEKLDAINATVNFAFANDKDAEFDEKTNAALDAIVKNLQADKNLKVLITGHTDNIGSEQVNIRYGKKRAETLKALIVKRGAPAAQISTASKGPKEPVASNDTEEGRYQNRRAVITIKP